MSETMRQRLDRLRGVPVQRNLRPYRRFVRRVRERCGGAAHDVEDLRGRAVEDMGDDELARVFAAVHDAAEAELGLCAYDEQLIAGLALARGRLVEMQTGEGKTLAAVFAVAAGALAGRGFHVLTFNDYLARRDAEWMGPVYARLGLTVGFVLDGTPTDDRRAAYLADITYTTAKQAGFDRLRDGLAMVPSERVLRASDPQHRALVDEADALLVDEARLPMVIAGVTGAPPRDLTDLAGLAAELRPDEHYEVLDGGRNVALTHEGSAFCQEALGCGDLYDEEQLPLLTAVNCALHAQALLRRDVDYLVRDGRIDLVDELTGRVIHDRQWPYGLQTALEAKEGLPLHPEGTVLDSMTVQHFIAGYQHLAGMTATAVAAASEVSETFGLETVVIGTHHPCIRKDAEDVVFATAEQRDAAVVAEVAGANGRPVLVGTTSVEASEALAARFAEAGIQAQVLNARHDAREAAIVAEAGALGAVTIATNMAGRGTDIRLGGSDGATRQEVMALGGLYVIGTQRHESRRIDDQLRGRSGRQGDPGGSRFFISLEDELVARNKVAQHIPPKALQTDADGRLKHPAVARIIAHAQRIIEGRHGDIRASLRRYSDVLHWQRDRVQDLREPLIREPFDDVAEEVRRRVELTSIRRLWSEHLGLGSELQETSFLERLGGLDPLTEYVRRLGADFRQFDDRLGEVVEAELARLGPNPSLDDATLQGPGTTWTYLIDDNPFQDSFGLGLIGARGFGAMAAVAAGPLLWMWAAGAWFRRRWKAKNV